MWDSVRCFVVRPKGVEGWAQQVVEKARRSSAPSSHGCVSGRGKRHGTCLNYTCMRACMQQCRCVLDRMNMALHVAICHVTTTLPSCKQRQMLAGSIAASSPHSNRGPKSNSYQSWKCKTLKPQSSKLKFTHVQTHICVVSIVETLC